MDLKKLIQQYYVDCKAMQLATFNDGQPWLSTVYFVSDDLLSLYWTSAKSRQHSREILDHPNVAVTIVKDIERKQALQIIGEARMVAANDVERVDRLYGIKFGDKPERLIEIRLDKPDGRAYWVFTPKVISLWDEVNFPDNPKQEYIVN
jgi:uncharacterized protein YhbP (UPF0306 family)